MTQSFDLGPAITTPHGVDRSLLHHCLQIADPHGWAVEFGVGKGDSLRVIANTHPCIGFDSGEGLPEDWRPEFRKGSFAHPLPTGIPGATIVPGLFADTVPNYDWPDQLALVHFDADLYSSTKTALDSIGTAVDVGTILVFDEWHGYDGAEDHEQRAFAEWFAQRPAFPLEYDIIGHGREQWAIQITGGVS